MMILELLILAAFSWVLRSMFVTSNQIGALSDSLAHLFMIKTQEGHARFNYSFDKAVIDTELGYPKLQHFIISRFPESMWLMLGGRLIILYDVATVVLFYLLVHFAYAPEAAAFSMGSPAFWSGLLFTTTPVLFSVNARLSGLGNARTFSLLQVFVLLVGWHLIGTDNLFAFFAMTALVMLVIVWASSFGLQVALFYALFVSLLTLDPVPILAVLISLALLYVLPVGARQILRHKYQHWVWYFRNYKKGTLPATRNRLADFIALPGLFISDRSRFQLLIYTRLTPIIFLCGVPSALIILWYQLTGQMPDGDTLIAFSQLVFWASLASFILISFERFAFLGEAERYLEYTTPFLGLLIVHLAVEGILPMPLLPLLLLVQLMLLAGQFWFKNRREYRLKRINDLTTPESRQMKSYLRRNYKTEQRVLTLPTKSAFYWSFFCFELNHVRFYQNFMGSEQGFRAMEEEMSHDNWVYPVQDLDIFRDRYGINRVLMAKTSAKVDTPRREEYGLTDDRILYENDGFILFSL